MSTADRGPLIGALLRLSHQRFVGKIMSRLADTEFADVQPSHFAPTQVLWDYENGIRLTELAAKAKITKQSMGELVDQIVQRGYAERIPDPADGRARLIKMTSRGRKVAQLVRGIVRDAEKDLAKLIGADKAEELRETLKMIVKTDW